MSLRNFQYSLPTQLIFGENCLEFLCARIKENSGTRVAVVMGRESARKNGVFDKTVSLLDLPLEIIDGCPQSPDAGFVAKSINQLKGLGVDFILAVGGGSVIDAAKAIALGLANGVDDIWLFKSQAEAAWNPALPVGVVLTTTGTGSEVNGGFVIRNECLSENYAFADLSTRPRFACCDPSVTTSLSVKVLEDNYADILSHLLEQYFSDDDVGYIDHLIVASIVYLLKGRDEFTRSNRSYHISSNLMLASSFAMSYLFSLGKHVNWVLHHCAHELSLIEDSSHGNSLKKFLPRWLSYLAQNKKYDHRFDLLAAALGVQTEKVSDQKNKVIDLIVFPSSEQLKIEPQILSELEGSISSNHHLCERAGLTDADLKSLFAR